MPATGDFAAFASILEFYHQTLSFASARTQAYFNHSGIFCAPRVIEHAPPRRRGPAMRRPLKGPRGADTETKTLFGAYSIGDYGASRPPTLPTAIEKNPFVTRSNLHRAASTHHRCTGCR